MYQKENLSALEAITEAQKIAFAPILFQAVWALRELGILSELDKAGSGGITISSLAERLDLSEYGIRVLLDMGLSGKVILQENDKYFLSKTGHFLLNDKMTRINMNFSQNFCYRAMTHLLESIKSGKPEGLKEYGKFETIYPALSSLPEPARTSWFELDHYYSDQAFKEAVPYVLKSKPSMVFDIGGNTGKCAKYFLDNCSVTSVKILDLQEQIHLAKQNENLSKYGDRLSFFSINMLDNTELPSGADVYWMSQFLDCFSETEIIDLLSKIRNSMSDDAKVYILELFCDRQKFEGAAYSLNAISLYFTCLANGNSRFYHSKDMIGCIKKAGLQVRTEINQLGLGHTLLECSKS